MKRLLIISVSFLAFLAVIYLAAHYWIVSNIKDILNQNPDRAYNISFQAIDMGPFLKSMELDELEITPISDDLPTRIKCEVDYVTISGMIWRELFLRKSLQIEKMGFVRPRILIEIGKDTTKIKKDPTKSVQLLFGDILSRGTIDHFRIYDGEVMVRNQGDTSNYFSLKRLMINADYIKTDSLQFQYLIPFHMVNSSLKFEEAWFRMNDLQLFQMESFSFTRSPSELVMKGISLVYTKPMKVVSNQLGIQKDLIQVGINEFKMNEITLRDEKTGDWDVQFNSGVIDQLRLKDYRDKNKERIDEFEKPLFLGMIQKIPFPVDLDTLILKDVDIGYMEVGEGKVEPGELRFMNGYVSAYHVTNIPEYQSVYERCVIDLITKINGEGRASGKLVIPYGSDDVFSFSIAIDTMDLKSLNQTLIPLAGVEVGSGNLHQLKFDMTTSGPESKNQLEMVYDNLQIEVLGEGQKKKGLLTMLANTFVRKQNLPSEKSYRVGSYSSTRNMDRGPFNFMWASLKAGFVEILPAKTVQKKLKKGSKK